MTGRSTQAGEEVKLLHSDRDQQLPEEILIEMFATIPETNIILSV